MSYLETERQKLYEKVENTLYAMTAQGYDTVDAFDKLAATPKTLDDLMAFAETLPSLPMMADWPYEEPSDWEGILASLENPPKKKYIALEEAQKRVRMGFLSSVCGCILGKPLEVNPTYAELKEAFSAVGAWPLSDYVPVAALEKLGRRHSSWVKTCRENIAYAAEDDDINYSVMGMLNLEENGLDFTQEQLAGLWALRLPPHYCWGPEREMLVRIAPNNPGNAVYDSSWPDFLNPGSELCGAMIRGDAYGFACPGDPLRAASLAWRDAAMTHRKNGVYGAMFAAAAIAASFTAENPEEVFTSALACIPPKSRFYERVSRGLDVVRASKSYEEAYETIHTELIDFCHCQVYQESATLINTLWYAKDIGDGIAKQVMQGNDTDSYGCTSGSILGCYFGEGKLEERWLAPFNDEISLGMAEAPEHRLSVLADRMAKLPALTL